MSHTIRRHALVLLLAVLAPASASAQSGSAPPPVWPTSSQTDAVSPPSSVVPATGAMPTSAWAWLTGASHAHADVGMAPGCNGHGPATCTPYEDRNGPLLIGDPLLDCAPGFVAGLEAGVVVPHVKNRLVAPVTLTTSGVTDLVHLPTADFGVRVMPKIELGYRFGQASGELLVSYRFVTAQSGQTVSPADLPPFAPIGTPLQSRLDLQVLDLDYANHEPLTVLGWDMKWRAGLRSMIFYSDSHANNGTLAEQTVNRYWGLGPHGMVDFRHNIGSTGLSVFARGDLAMVFGRVAQRYSETVLGVDTGESRFFLNAMVTHLSVEGGIAWHPPSTDRFGVSAGYIFEHFYHLGAIGTPISAREDLLIQGGFLRAEWNY